MSLLSFEGDPRPVDSVAAGAASSEPRGPDRPTGTGARDYTSAVYGSVLAATVVVSAGDLRAEQKFGISGVDEIGDGPRPGSTE